MSAEQKRTEEPTTVGPAESAEPPRGNWLPTQLPAPFGRYRVLKLLGKGGMGSVYLAHDSQLDRPVAVKIPLLEGGDESQVLARFFREARAAAALQHPNICPIFDVGAMDATPYLTMAFIDGKSLAEFVRSRPLLPRQSALLVRKLALALQEAHTRGVIHRDLKPANVMIDKRSEPVIMDFGLARRARKSDPRLTRIGEVMGTPAYMPPEQVSGDVDAMGPGSDIYSLGVILYELLAGRLPFSGDGMAMLSQVLLDDPPPPSRFRPDLDPDLEAICLRALAKKVPDRHASMASLAAALADYLRGKSAAPEVAPLPPSPPPEPPPETMKVPARIAKTQMGNPWNQLDVETPSPRAGDSGTRRRRNEKTEANRPGRRSKPASGGIEVWWFLAGLAGVLLFAGLVIGALAWLGRSQSKVGEEASQKRKKDQGVAVSRAAGQEVLNSVSLKQLREAVPAYPNDARLQARVGEANYWGWNGAIDHAEAKHWFRKAADLDDPRGMAGLGWIFFAGNNTKVDLEAAVKWFSSAAKKQDAWGLQGLARATATGRGVPQDQVAADQLYHKSRSAYAKDADRGDTHAMARLGQLCEEGLGGNKDDGAAMEWYRKAALRGNTEAMVRLGFLYQDSSGTTGKDEKEAVSWFGKAAKQGNSLGQFALGVMYADGRGVAKNDKEAVEWYRKAAKQGNALAQFNLGWLNESGPSLAPKTIRMIEWAGNHIYHTAFSPNGQLYLAGGDTGTLRIWEVSTGRQIVELPISIGLITPDGKQVVGYNNEKTILVYDLTGKILRTLDVDEAITGMAIGPDGKQIVCGHADKAIRLWDLATGKVVRKFEGHTEPASVAFSPSGQHILSASADKTIRLWDVETGKQVRSFDDFKDVTALEGNGLIVRGMFAGEGRVAGYVWGKEKTFVLWDAATGMKIRQLDLGPDHHKDVAVSGDGRWLLTGHEDRTVRLLDVRTGKEWHRFVMTDINVPRGLSFSPDGKYAAAGSHRSWLYLWQLRK